MPSRDALLLFALFFLALTLRLVQIDQESFFIDEVVTLRATEGSALMHALDVEVTPPLYFYLMSAGSKILPMFPPMLAFRIFPAIAGALGAVALMVAAREMRFSRAASNLTGLLAALSPMGIWYGQQGRCYALLAALIALWLLLATKSIHANKKRWLVFLSITMLAGFSTHYYFALAILGGTTILATYYLFHRDNHLLRNSVLTQLITMACFLLYLPLLLAQLSRNHINWIPRPSLNDLIETFTDVFMAGPFHQLPPTGKWLALAFYASVAMFSIARLKKATGTPPWGWFLIQARPTRRRRV